MNMQITKIGRKACLLLRGDRLVFEENNLMLKQRLLDGIALLRAQGAGQVNAVNLGAKGRANRGNGQARGLSLYQRAD